MVKIVWAAKAIKQLRRIDSRYHKPIRKVVGELSGFPLVNLDIKKLKGASGMYRLRIGDYRVFFDITDGEPRVLEVREVCRRQTKTY